MKYKIFNTKNWYAIPDRNEIFRVGIFVGVAKFHIGNFLLAKEI